MDVYPSSAPTHAAFALAIVFHPDAAPSGNGGVASIIIPPGPKASIPVYTPATVMDNRCDALAFTYAAELQAVAIEIPYAVDFGLSLAVTS